MKKNLSEEKVKGKKYNKKENYYLMENILNKKGGQEKYINIIKMN